MGGCYVIMYLLDQRTLEETEIAISLPDSLQVGEVFIGLLHQSCEAIKFLQLLFVGVVEVGGYENWILCVRDLVIHQVMEIKEDISSEFVEGCTAIEVVGIRGFATSAH